MIFFYSKNSPNRDIGLTNVCGRNETAIYFRKDKKEYFYILYLVVSSKFLLLNKPAGLLKCILNFYFPPACVLRWQMR